MGLISRIKNTFQGKMGELLATVERFKNDTATAKIYNPAGIDARPIDNDVCLSEHSEDTEGGRDVLGFVTTQVSAKGEVRIFSRDSDGNIKATMHVKNDGDILIDAGKDLVIDVAGDVTFNSIGDIDLTAPNLNLTGNLNITGALDVTSTITCDSTISAVGNISSEDDVVADSAVTSTTLSTHYHFGNLGFNTSTSKQTGGTALPAGGPSLDGSGNLDMNGKSIIDVNLVDGIDVSTHKHDQASDTGGDTEARTTAPV